MATCGAHSKPDDKVDHVHVSMSEHIGYAWGSPMQPTSGRCNAPVALVAAGTISAFM
jgi:hypothetical protein